LLLTLFAVGAASLTFILGRCPPESDESLQPLPSEAEGKAVPEILVLRIGAKKDIVDEVIAGRLSLVQAAALFGALNQLPPESVKPSLSDLDPSRLRFLAHSDEDRLCQQVVRWVSWELAGEPDRREATVARLEAEFKAALRKEGTVRLPDPLTLVPVQKLLEQAREELQRSPSEGGEKRRTRPRNADARDQDGRSQKKDS
jgi:hypothetical protein